MLPRAARTALQRQTEPTHERESSVVPQDLFQKKPGERRAMESQSCGNPRAAANAREVNDYLCNAAARARQRLPAFKTASRSFLHALPHLGAAEQGDAEIAAH